jgi:hypothetical protein
MVVPNKTEAAFAKIFAQRIGFGCRSKHLAVIAPYVSFWFAADELPDIGIKAAEFLLHGEARPRVRDRRIDFEAVANYSRVFE